MNSIKDKTYFLGKMCVHLCSGTTIKKGNLTTPQVDLRPVPYEEIHIWYKHGQKYISRDNIGSG